MPFQPVSRRFVLVDVEIVQNHVQLAFREGRNHVLEEAQGLGGKRRWAKEIYISWLVACYTFSACVLHTGEQ